MTDLLGVPFLDRNFGDSVATLPVNRRGRQGDIERYVVVAGRERFQICPYLVGRIATAGRAVSTGNDDIDQAMLHKVSTRVIHDKRMRHVALGEFPSGQLRALVAWPRFVDPDMDGDAALLCEVDWRRRCAIVNSSEGARIAVRQHIDRLTRFAPGNLFEQGDTVVADTAAYLDILVAYRLRIRTNRIDELSGVLCVDKAEYAIDCPTQVYGGRTGPQQGGRGRVHRSGRRILECRQIQAPRGCRAD